MSLKKNKVINLFNTYIIMKKNIRKVWGLSGYEIFLNY